MASPQYDSSYVLQDDYYLRKTYHNGYIEIISLQCESSDLLQEPYTARKSYHNGCIQMFSHRYEFSYVLEYEHYVILAALVWFILIPQCTYIHNRQDPTPDITPTWLFTSVCHHMVTYPRRVT